MLWQIVCECLQQQHPNIQQVLQSIQRSSVCTGTQCFQNMEDAGFGRNTSNVEPFDETFAIFMFILLGYMIANRPKNMWASNKPAVLLIGT